MSDKKADTYSVVDLFSGVGGLSFGFEWNKKFNVTALNDIDEDCKETYLKNFPKSNFIRDDITRTGGEKFVELNNDKPIDIVIGGPPCQGFSMAGKQLFEDERNHLFRQFLRLIVELNPKVVLMENVPEILRVFGEYVKNELTAFFEKNKYVVTANVLNAANYGVPQTRNRAFILAVKKELGVQPTLPQPTNDGSYVGIFNYLTKKIEPPAKCYGNEIMGKNNQTYHWLKRNGRLIEKSTKKTIDEYCSDKTGINFTTKPLVTVWEAMGDLPHLPEGVKQKTEYKKEPFTEYQRWIRGNENILNNHNRWGHTKEMMERIRLLPEGGNMKDLPKSHQVSGAYSQAYSRLHRNGLARTITTFVHNPGSGRFVHPIEDRAISIREAARLQSFPDSFVFCGKLSSQERQVGNAVPPLVSKALADHILNVLNSVSI